MSALSIPVSSFPLPYLHANSTLDLVTYCENEKVPFVTFRDWSTIFQTTKDIVAGKTTVQEAAKGRI